MTPVPAGEKEEQEEEEEEEEDDDYYVHVIDTTKTSSLSMLSDDEDSTSSEEEERDNLGSGKDDVKNDESYKAYSKELSFSLMKSIHGHLTSSGEESKKDNHVVITSIYKDSPVKIFWSSPIILRQDSIEDATNNRTRNTGWSTGGNQLSIQSSFSNTIFYDTSSSTSSDRWWVKVGATSQKLLLHKLGVSSTYLSLGYQIGYSSGVELTLRDLGSDFCQTQFSFIKKNSALQPTTDSANSYKNHNHNLTLGISIPAHHDKPYYLFLTSPQLLLPNKKLLLSSRLVLPAQYPLPPSSSFLSNVAAEICFQTTLDNQMDTSRSFQTKLRVGNVAPTHHYSNSTMQVINPDSTFTFDTHHPILLSIIAPPILHTSGSSSIVTLNCGMFGHNNLRSRKDSFHFEETRLPFLQLAYKSLLSSTWNLNFDILSSKSPHRFQLGIITSFLSERFTRLMLQYSRAGGGITVRIPITLLAPTASIHSHIYFSLQTMYVTLLTTIVHDVLTDILFSTKLPNNTLLLTTSTDDFPIMTMHEKQKEEAARQIMLLTKSALVNRKLEDVKGGLVIEQAYYYYYSLSTVTHDVTVPLQFWVSDSTLKLPSGSKSTMLGFYDIRRPQRAKKENIDSPKSIISSIISLVRNSIFCRHKEPSTEVLQENICPDQKNRVKLYVRYKFCGITNEVTIFDEDELILP